MSKIKKTKSLKLDFYLEELTEGVQLVLCIDKVDTHDAIFNLLEGGNIKIDGRYQVPLGLVSEINKHIKDTKLINNIADVKYLVHPKRLLKRKK